MKENTTQNSPSVEMIHDPSKSIEFLNQTITSVWGKLWPIAYPALNVKFFKWKRKMGALCQQSAWDISMGT